MNIYSFFSSWPGESPLLWLQQQHEFGPGFANWRPRIKGYGNERFDLQVSHEMSSIEQCLSMCNCKVFVLLFVHITLFSRSFYRFVSIPIVLLVRVILSTYLHMAGIP